MIRVHRRPERRAAVQALRHAPTLRSTERERVEMVLLAAAGGSPPRMARSLGCHPTPVRPRLKRVATTGPVDLRRRRPGPPQDAAGRQQVTAARVRLVDQPRTWAAAPLAEALRSEGSARSARQTRKDLQLLGARWRRTVARVQHQPAPARAGQAGRVRANLKKTRTASLT